MTVASCCWADDIGVERDAPTFSTGETIEVGTKRITSTFDIPTLSFFLFYLDLHQEGDFGGLPPNRATDRDERQRHITKVLQTESAHFIGTGK